jgi:Flp pilus assembly protein CpaB
VYKKLNATIELLVTVLRRCVVEVAHDEHHQLQRQRSKGRLRLTLMRPQDQRAQSLFRVVVVVVGSTTTDQFQQPCYASNACGGIPGSPCACSLE